MTNYVYTSYDDGPLDKYDGQVCNIIEPKEIPDNNPGQFPQVTIKFWDNVEATVSGHDVQVLACLDDHGDKECSGEVEFRMPLSASGRPFPRCDGHWEKRLEEQERINERYPQHRPSDFSELDAGESWEELDY